METEYNIKHTVYDLSTEDNFEIMINDQYGGFGLSKKAVKLYCEKTNIDYKSHNAGFECGVNDVSATIERTDVNMIQIVKELGSEANGKYCTICIEQIPIKYKDSYEIYEYDGKETVRFNHNKYKLQFENKKLMEENSLLKKENKKLQQELEQYRTI
jgi:hypothetical protein